MEAERKATSKRLAFGFCEGADLVDLDWIGAAYVKANSLDEAKTKVNEFFEINATRWSFDGVPEVVTSLREFEMDFEVIEKRGDMVRFESGEVIVGWGM